MELSRLSRNTCLGRKPIRAKEVVQQLVGLVQLLQVAS